MAKKFWLQKRGKVFYALNSESGQKESLRVRDKAEAERLVHSKNEAAVSSVINLSIAKVYLQAVDPKLLQRPWQDVMNISGAVFDQDRDGRRAADATARRVAPSNRVAIPRTSTRSSTRRPSA